MSKGGRRGAAVAAAAAGACISFWPKDFDRVKLLRGGVSPGVGYRMVVCAPRAADDDTEEETTIPSPLLCERTHTDTNVYAHTHTRAHRITRAHGDLGYY